MERVCFSPLAAVGRALERTGDTSRIGSCKHSFVQIESVARFGHALGPTLRFFKRHGLRLQRLRKSQSTVVLFWIQTLKTCCKSAVPLEKLDGPLMLLGRASRFERAEVPTPSGF